MEKNFLDKLKEKAIELLKSSEEYEEYNELKISHILERKDNINESLVVVVDEAEEGVIDVYPLTNDKEKICPCPDWAFSFESDLFERLQDKNWKLVDMNMLTHFSIWTELNMYYPEEYENKKGVQIYLDYCKKNKITKEKIEKETKLELDGDAMKFYKKSKDKEI